MESNLKMVLTAIEGHLTSNAANKLAQILPMTRQEIDNAITILLKEKLITSIKTANQDFFYHTDKVDGSMLDTDIGQMLKTPAYHKFYSGSKK